jgi:dihydroflavonol-4-reductase
MDTSVNLIDVRDCAAGHLAAAERGVIGRSYILGGRNVSAVELARLVLRLTGRRRPVLVVPSRLAALAARLLTAVSDHVTRRPPLFTPAAVAIARLGLDARPERAARELGLSVRPLEESVRAALG